MPLYKKIKIKNGDFILISHSTTLDLPITKSLSGKVN